jgi:hypothetical protein
MLNDTHEAIGLTKELPMSYYGSSNIQRQQCLWLSYTVIILSKKTMLNDTHEAIGLAQELPMSCVSSSYIQRRYCLWLSHTVFILSIRNHAQRHP